jgi:hypothetical protein
VVTILLQKIWLIKVLHQCEFSLGFSLFCLFEFSCFSLENHEYLSVNLDQILHLYQFKEFWIPMEKKLIELNLRNKFFSPPTAQNLSVPPNPLLSVGLSYEYLSKSGLQQRSNDAKRRLTSEEENSLLSKIYMLETNNNFTSALPVLDIPPPYLPPQNPATAAASSSHPTITPFCNDVLYYPMLFLSYSELLDISDALLYLYCFFHRNIIIIFVPDFLLDIFMIEMKTALDQMKRSLDSSSSLAYSSQSNIGGSLTGNYQKEIISPFTSADKSQSSKKYVFESSKVVNDNAINSNDRKSYIKEKQQQLMMAYQKDRKTPPAGVVPSISTSSSSKNNGKDYFNTINNKTQNPKISSSMSKGAADVSSMPTSFPLSIERKDLVWTYKVIMDVISKMQKEHAVSISIFI